MRIQTPKPDHFGSSQSLTTSVHPDILLTARNRWIGEALNMGGFHSVSRQVSACQPSNKPAFSSLLVFWIILLASALPCSGVDADAEKQALPEWLNRLRPATTRADVYALIGRPLDTDKAKSYADMFGEANEYYKMGNNLFILKFEEGGHGAELSSCYSSSIEDVAKKLNLKARHYFKYSEGENVAVNAYFKAGRFEYYPDFDQVVFYHAPKYPGHCYPVDSGYLSISRFIPDTEPAMPFANTTFWAKFITREGAIRDLYSIKEGWPKFRPPGVTDEMLDERERVLRASGLKKIGKIWDEFLGKPDAMKHSNMAVHLYYFRHGLIAVSTSGRGKEDQMLDEISIDTFEEHDVELAQWLKSNP